MKIELQIANKKIKELEQVISKLQTELNCLKQTYKHNIYESSNIFCKGGDYNRDEDDDYGCMKHFRD